MEPSPIDIIFDVRITGTHSYRAFMMHVLLEYIPIELSRCPFHGANFYRVPVLHIFLGPIQKFFS